MVNACGCRSCRTFLGPFPSENPIFPFFPDLFAPDNVENKNKQALGGVKYTK